MKPNKIITKTQLQIIIDAIVLSSQKTLDENHFIPFSVFKNKIEKLTKPYLEDKLLDKKKIKEKQNKFLQNVKHLINTASSEENIIALNQVLEIYSKSDFFNLSLNMLNIVIVGAGPAGLLTAYILAKQGAYLTVYETRTATDATSRPQNISFKDAEIHLKPVLGEIYQTFFERGAALDGKTNKLRITIGAFQEVLLAGLEKLDVKTHFETPISLTDTVKLKGADIILIAAGFHAYEKLQLKEYFDLETFEQHTATGKTALFIEPSDEKPGYKRKEREGHHWHRVNKTVYSGQTLNQDIERVIKNLHKLNKNLQLVPQLEEMKKNSNVAYTFIFGNNTPDFLKDIDNKMEPIYETQYEVIPTIMCNPISQYKNIPLIAIGDSNGSPNPLAAIGTLKFIKDPKNLVKFIFAYQTLKQLKDAKVVPPEIINDLIVNLYELYALSAMKEIKVGFFENILSSIFSKPRQYDRIPDLEQHRESW